MAALTQMGSYSNTVTTGENILESIWENILEVTGVELSKPLRLRHIRIKSEPNMLFTINGYTFETDTQGIFTTPNNDSGNLVNINEFISQQNTTIEVYYLR